MQAVHRNIRLYLLKEQSRIHLLTYVGTITARRDEQPEKAKSDISTSEVGKVNSTRGQISMRALTEKEVLTTLIYIIILTHIRELTRKSHVPEVSDRPGIKREKLDFDHFLVRH